MCVIERERGRRRHMRREGKSGVDNLMTPFVSLKSSSRHPFECLDVPNFVTKFSDRIRKLHPFSSSAKGSSRNDVLGLRGQGVS